MQISAQDYETHCSQHHGLNSKTCCVWCNGNVSWRGGQKYHHVDHLTQCFNRFYDSTPARSSAPPRSIQLNPTCSEVESFFDHSTSIHNLLPPRAFQSIWLPPERTPPPITFQMDILNLAASHLQLYLETRHTHDWLHVMVKAVAFESFLRAVDRDEGRTRILDFWCWCDGGVEFEDIHRQHRHMIAVSQPPRGRFKRNVWSRVKANPSPRSNFPCKIFKEIESPLHLVETLGYLSQRQSGCNFSRTRGPTKNNHFYISKSLPIGYKLPLATLWPGGVQELLYVEKFQNVSIPRVIENPLFRAKGGTRQWKQKIEDFYDLERGLVIPVDKQLEPTRIETTPHFIHLTQNKKLYFTPNPENETLDEASWLQMQAEKGNSFYDALGRETWTPRPKDQKRINDMMLLMKKIQTLEEENESLKRKWEEEKAQLQEENISLKRKWEEEKEVDKGQLENLNQRTEQFENAVKKCCSKCVTLFQE